MGQQTGFLQLPDDEHELLSWVSERYNVLSLPRSYPPGLKPMALGYYHSREQVIFLTQFSAEVLSTQCECPWSPGNVWLSPTTSDPIVIEATLSPLPSENVIVYKVGTRIYFRPVPGDPRSLLTAKLFAAVRARIIRESPLRTASRYPIYAGKHLCAAIKANQLTAMYPSGQLIEFLVNEKSKT